MKIFLSIKYYDDMRNKNLIEKIYNIISLKGNEVFVFAKNIQNYGECTMTPKEVMEKAFSEIDSSDILLAEASNLSIGVGIEVGYAYSKKIPVYLIASKKSFVSNSIKGISSKSLFYEKIDEISNLF